MAVPVLLVGKLFHQLDLDEENHCEIQSCIGLSDKKRQSAKMASFLVVLIMLGHHVVPDTSCRGHIATGGSICHLR